MSLVSSVRSALAADGPLAVGLPGYAPRQGQMDMAAATAGALERREQLLVEAGTGVGKTYAYLVPALLWGRRVVISTGTRNLQDQLFKRDLPALAGALGAPLEVALLKGRGNYLCLHRLEGAGLDSAGLGSGDLRYLARIQQWSRTTRSGDINELSGIPEQARVWPRVTSTSDNCLGSACPHWQDCHVVRARRDALRADIIVVNHHLLLADLALKDEGFGELLPAADAVIVDEAHQLADVATQFFGTSVSSRQLVSLLKDLRAESLNAGLLDTAMERLAAAVEKALAEVGVVLGSGHGRRDWPGGSDRFAGAVDTLTDEMLTLSAALGPLVDHSVAMEAVARRSAQTAERLNRLSGPPDPDEVRWVETWTRGFALHGAPVDAGPALADKMQERPAAWVFTSATLAVDGDFALVRQRLGLPDAEALTVESPFDFRQRSRIYLPAGTPAPGSDGYTQHALEAARPVLEASGGGAFFLFTSHRALAEAAAWFRDGARAGDRPLLVQGDEPRDRLLRRFRESGHAVLLGTGSFWEGVDVRGQDLRLVVIDRLPFAVPDDPVLKARLERVRESGGNPFRDVQVPEAALTLKQGVGRLMRDVNDSGVVVLCDPRLVRKSYGRLFIRALPPMPVEHDEAEVVRFMRAAVSMEPAA